MFLVINCYLLLIYKGSIDMLYKLLICYVSFSDVVLCKLMIWMKDMKCYVSCCFVIIIIMVVIERDYDSCYMFFIEVNI